jgi:hypothetical protein
MTGLFEWLLKAVLVVALLPCALSLGWLLISTLLVTLLPWVIGLVVLLGLSIGAAAGLVQRHHLPPAKGPRFPPGEVPRIRRPRGVRTER